QGAVPPPPPSSSATEKGPEDPEWFDRQQTYTLAVLRALDSLAAQVDASRQALTFEVGKLDGPSETRTPRPEPLQLAMVPKEPPLAALAEVRRRPEATKELTPSQPEVATPAPKPPHPSEG